MNLSHRLYSEVVRELRQQAAASRHRNAQHEATKRLLHTLVREALPDLLQLAVQRLRVRTPRS